MLCAICVPVAVEREQTHFRDTLSSGVLCGMGASAMQCSAGWVHAMLCRIGRSALQDGCIRCCVGWVQCSAGWVHALLCGIRMGAGVAVRDGCSALRDGSLWDGCMHCCAGCVQCSAGWVHALLCGMGAVLCRMGACVAVRDWYIQCRQRLSVARVKRDITQHVCTLFGYQPFLYICICISVFSREKIRKPTRLPLQYTMLYSADYYCTEEYRGL